MIDFDNNEEEIRRLLRSTYKPASLSPELKEKLHERLMHEGRATLPREHHLRYGRPKVWVPIAATVISMVIGYGIWLSLTQPLPWLLPSALPVSNSPITPLPAISPARKVWMSPFHWTRQSATSFFPAQPHDIPSCLPSLSSHLSSRYGKQLPKSKEPTTT